MTLETLIRWTLGLLIALAVMIVVSLLEAYLEVGRELPVRQLRRPGATSKASST